MAAVLSCTPTARRVPDQQWMPHCVSSQAVYNMLLLSFLPQGLIPADLLEVGGKQVEGVNWMHTIPLSQFLGL